MVTKPTGFISFALARIRAAHMSEWFDHVVNDPIKTSPRDDNVINLCQRLASLRVSPFSNELYIPGQEQPPVVSSRAIPGKKRPIYLTRYPLKTAKVPLF
jgi:hypothetical protein